PIARPTCKPSPLPPGESSARETRVRRCKAGSGNCRAFSSRYMFSPAKNGKQRQINQNYSSFRMSLSLTSTLDEWRGSEPSDNKHLFPSTIEETSFVV